MTRKQNSKSKNSKLDSFKIKHWAVVNTVHPYFIMWITNHTEQRVSTEPKAEQQQNTARTSTQTSQRLQNLLGNPTLPNRPGAPGKWRHSTAPPQYTKSSLPFANTLYSTQHNLRSAGQIRQKFCSFRLESKCELILWSPSTLKWNLCARSSKHRLFLRKLSKNSTTIKAQPPESLREQSQFHDDTISWLSASKRHCPNDGILLRSSQGPHSAPQHFKATHS